MAKQATRCEDAGIPGGCRNRAAFLVSIPGAPLSEVCAMHLAANVRAFYDVLPADVRDEIQVRPL